MTHLFDDPTRFKDEMLAGFLAAYPHYVRRVPAASGAMRADGPRPGKVAVVIGGGAGHYPAFCGLVGDGLADAAVVGDVFTSPSAEQAYRVAKAVDGGAGVLFSFGNYAGDVMNFGAAQDRLQATGVDCRTVLVTDDVASGNRDEAEKRRGVAGGLFVFKVAGAAAERGASLAEVERIARKANDHTRTIGVAYSGCTLPGRAEPLFTVARGAMEVGLGIHGEAGVESSELLSARSTSHLMTSRLLQERPPGGGNQVALLVNGLGATKYEELFVLAGSILRELEALGVEVVHPEVGEFVTSLDMAGCSLSVLWLDDELRELWVAPADSPAFRRGPTLRTLTPSLPSEPTTPAIPPDVPPFVAAGATKRDADPVRRGLHAMRNAVLRHHDLLCLLDAVAGDGDHGSGMLRGLAAATQAADACAGGPAQVLVEAGAAFADRAGGTSGMLWGGMLRAAGEALADETATTEHLVVDAVDAAVHELGRLGGAQPGDKTMLDALVPLARTLRQHLEDGHSLQDAWAAAAEAATRAAADTANLAPRVGRARPLAQRSLGSADPGATSLALCAMAIGELSGEGQGRPPAS